MTAKKITALPALSLPVRDTDQIPVVRSSVNYQAPVSAVRSALSGSGAPTSIVLTSSGIAENSGSNLTVGTLSVVGETGTFTFDQPQVFDKATLAGTNNVTVKTTAVPFDYERAPAPKMLVGATRGITSDSDYLRIVKNVVVPVLNDPADDPAVPTWFANLKTQVFGGGAAIGNLNVTLGDLDAVGLPVSPGTEYIGGRSMDPINWSRISGSTVVAQTTVNGFNTVDFHMLYDTITATGLRAMTIGEKVTVKIKIGLVPTHDASGGIQIGFTGCVTTGEVQNTTNTLGLPTGTPPTGVQFISRTLISAEDAQELVYTITAQSAGTPQIYLRSYNNSSGPSWLRVWGLSMPIGGLDKPWVAVATTIVTIPGTTLTTSGVVRSTLVDTAGTIAMRIKNVSSTLPAKLFSNGATTGIENTIARVTGPLTVDVDGTTTARVGMGGFAGSAMIALAWDASGYRIAVNGGKVTSVATALPVAAVARLLSGTVCTLEYIAGYNRKLTANELLIASQLPDMEGVALSDRTFNDVFADLAITDIIRTRASVAMSSLGVSNTGNVNLYTGTGPNGRAKWMPRPATDKTNTGSNLGGGEDEWYIDPSQPGLPADFSTVYPFVKASDGALRIKATARIDCPADMQAIFPNKWSGGVFTGTDSGNKLAYLSGLITTAGQFEQKYGYTEVEMKVPLNPWAFPAFWTLSGVAMDYNPSQGPYGAEKDIFERFGDTRSSTAVAMTLHLNMYGYNQEVVGDAGNGALYPLDPGVNYTDNYTTFGELWWPGYVQYFQNGRALCPPVSTAGRNVDGTSHYLLLNLAMGANFIRSGVTPDQSLGNVNLDIARVSVFAVA